MTRTLDDLIQIVRNGGSLDLQLGNLSKEDLTQLVRNVSEKGTIILRGANTRSTDELVDISRNATGRVIFVLD